MSNNQACERKKESRTLLVTAAWYAAYCAIGLVSRFVPVAFVLFVLFGIAFPLLWAKFSGDGQVVGFTKRNLGKALLWGLGTGFIWGVYTYVVFGEGGPLPALWGLQVAIALPIWLLVWSPFQEFFFRGWMQPRLEGVIGKGWGLVATSLAFTAWHFFPQLQGTMTTTLPLSSALGIVSIFASGCLFGYIYQRTDSIVAPWLAHALGGIALVLMGRMIFLQYSP